MNPEALLRAPRPIHLLVRKPGSGSDGLSWTMRLDGLHQLHIKESVTTLRKDRQKHGDQISQPSLKPKALHDAVIAALGMSSYDDWVGRGQSSLINFLHDNGMSQPTDLLTWEEGTPGLGKTLTARCVADRLFNSGLPLPKRIFTGAGSLMFAAKGYGHYDLSGIMCNEPRGYDYGLAEALDFCGRHAQQVVLRAARLNSWSPKTPDCLDLTGHQILLNAFGFEAGAFFNLLGSNLVDPPTGEPLFRLYNATAEEEGHFQQLFAVFRSEMERSTQGWVDVVPLPGNDNIIFLKGRDGAFDWVVRDQRDEAYSDNPCYPVLHKRDLPSAMKVSDALASHLYYRLGTWREKLEHDAETRHYSEGGSAANWPGYVQLVQRELAASQGYVHARQKQGEHSPAFLSHRLDDQCLMVSPLVSIREFWRLYSNSHWKRIRQERLYRSGQDLDQDLSAINLHDPEDLPASVTWFDAVAYCKAYEDETGLPVRLLNIDEWRQVLGDVTGPEQADSGLPRVVTGQLPGPLCYVPDPVWRTSESGLKTLYASDFGEWLSGYQSGRAPAACAATGESIYRGPLERAVLPADNTMRYKRLKVGFRLCYVARPDA